MTTTLAMHMSDGLVTPSTALAFGRVAVLGLALAAARARRDLDDQTLTGDLWAPPT